MIDATLLGTGGMMPLPGRTLTALYGRCGGRALLIDCGEGPQTAIRTTGLWVYAHRSHSHHPFP